MVRMTMEQEVAGLFLLMMIAVAGCRQQTAGPNGKTSGSPVIDSTPPTDQPSAQTLREITLNVTGMS